MNTDKFSRFHHYRFITWWKNLNFQNPTCVALPTLDDGFIVGINISQP